MKIFPAVLMVLTMASLSSAQIKNPPEVIFINGDIYVSSPNVPNYVARPQDFNPAWLAKRVQAIAVLRGKIVAIGANAEVQKLKAESTQVIDLHGHFVMPGFNDAHAHLASGGFEKLDIDLVGSKSLDEMKQRIAARAKTAAPGEWLVGRGWDHTLWANQTLPTRSDLDAVTGDHPAIFSRVDGHISVANSAALKAANITAQTPDPAGGKIDHDDQGEPTGILRETAVEDLSRKIPKPSAAQHKRAAELALQDAARWGLTSAQDNSAWEDFLAYEELEKEGKLTLRISEWLPFDATLEQLNHMRNHHPADDSMLAPYTDDPKNSGIPRYQQDALNQKTAERVKDDFQIGFHAIGDRGARMALEAFEFSRPQTAKIDIRYRIEHDQVVAPEDFKKYKELGVIASMQPNHLLTDMNWAESHIGPERARHSYPWKEFWDAGIPLAFGTDYPVEPITPFRGLYCAVTRKNEAGTKAYHPEQKLNIDQAIFAYTLGAAYAEFQENVKGWLLPGMLADFVVLDRDITKVAPPQILKTRVLRTVVGGQTVYATADVASPARPAPRRIKK